MSLFAVKLGQKAVVSYQCVASIFRLHASPVGL